ncbi:sin3 histone deacetylase corepressor complex component SDS3-like [Anopheles ziemanni]|uniref:sin3 histone deacetylase corepressor complex component SDS3-like n=1 Tax=Anopheles ziemanni TaxID=345580 RepID=UPI00265AF942|nr:sin3 histone deacetylase corepressor complex component SDS3-like isoform X2 [Anopheles coustani]XP_058169505.1 sin3 histone deacetylase corepressor complex component SDS3-like [Anopheles ziemanni]
MSSNQRSTLEEGPEENTEHEYEAYLSEDNEYDSGEDTEEASETELGSSMNQRTMDERMEIKEQMYQDKLANLMHQMDLLKMGKHPDYLRRVETLTVELEDRLMLNELHRDYMLQCAERECANEIAAAEKEFEEKAAELKETLIAVWEDRKKMVEQEHATMELSGDSIDVKPTVSRKLRRRPNEPLPVPEKRRKPSTSQLVFLLDEKEIEHDLKLVLRGKPSYSGRSEQHGINEGASTSSGAGPSGINPSTSAHSSSGNSGGSGYASGQPCSDQNGASTSDVYASGSQTAPSSLQQQQQQPLSETRIEDGKLWYERRWFHRGQPVYVEGKDISRFSGNISAIGVDGICVKKTSDGQKVRIFLSHLRRGKVSIKRRAN